MSKRGSSAHEPDRGAPAPRVDGQQDRAGLELGAPNAVPGRKARAGSGNSLLLLALVLITLAAHWRVLQNDFVNYDDNDYVTDNPLVQKGLTVEGVKWAFGNLHGAKTYWHPLTWVSHMADCQFFGLHPAGHHAMNLLFHTINVLLLFLVLERMTGARWRSVVVAALWAVHPLQVDTVAWVSERKNVLSALCWLLTMAAWLRYAARPGPGRYLLVLLGMALGLMCKPVLVTLPCALLLLDFWPLKRWRPRDAARETSAPAFAPASFGRLFLEKVPLLALSGIASLVTLIAHNQLGIHEESFGLTPALKIQNAVVSYVRYLDNSVWPAKLTVLYLHPGKWPGGTVGLSAALLLVVTVLTLMAVRTRPYLLVGWLWFLGVLVPMIGLRQAGIHAMADRFMYLPLVGLLVMFVWTFADWFAGSSRRTVAAVTVALASVIGYAAASNVQAGHWRNSTALWQRALAINPDNFLAHGNLSATCFSLRQFDLARQHAAEAVRLRPDYVEQHIQLGVLSLREGRPDEARGHFDRALRARPDAPLTVRRLAAGYAGDRDFDTAIAMFSACTVAMPADMESRLQLAMLLQARGRAVEAAQHYREALRQQPDQPGPLNNLAWLLATSPDAAARNGAEAVTLAERACQQTGRRYAVFIGTLAAAYAEAGRYEDAVRAASEAIAVASGAGETNVVESNRQLLEFYRAGRPYHEPAAK